MAFPRRHPRFSLLLASLIFIALLFLLPHSPLIALQPSPASSEALKKAPPVVYHGVSARVRRAERAYQKMLRGRDALIGKVGPTPRDVALSVILFGVFFVFVPSLNNSHRFPPDKEPWPAYTACEFGVVARISASADGQTGDFFLPAFSCPHELERIGALGDGGKWVCGLSQLQEKEDCIVYSVGTYPKRFILIFFVLRQHVSHRLGSPADASFEAELLARTRHCQLFVFDHTASSLPRALTTPSSLPIALGEFYSAASASDMDDEHDYWDSRGIAQRSHFKPYRIAGYDAHASGDNPKIYTLESLMRLNGAPRNAPT